jgi:hypothetical protein
VRKALSLAAALTILAAGGCGGDDEEEPAGSAALKFFGSLEDRRELVAVTVEGSTVRAFVSDGRRTAEWFGGILRGSSFTLNSTAGVRDVNKAGRGTPTNGNAQLEGEIGDELVSGTVRLGRRGPFDFTAAAAEPPGDIYTLRVLPDGSVDGASKSSDRVRARATKEKDSDTGVVGVIAGELTLANGETVDFDVRRDNGPPRPGVWSVLVTPEGDAVGFSHSGVDVPRGPGFGFVPPPKGFAVAWG